MTELKSYALTRRPRGENLPPSKEMRGSHVKIVKGCALLAALAIVVGASPTPPAVAGRIGQAAAEKTGLTRDACFEHAQRVTTGPWMCVGSELSVEVSPGAWTSRPVPGVPTLVKRADAITTLADDYDYWCETVPTCTRYISPYVAEIKGNAAFGVGSDVYGRFDVIWRQNFNGPYSRYRLLLIWDAGSAVDSDFWRAQVREERTGLPDPVRGAAYFYPATISSASWRAWAPNSTGYAQVDEPIASTSATHHDDLYG